MSNMENNMEPIENTIISTDSTDGNIEIKSELNGHSNNNDNMRTEASKQIGNNFSAMMDHSDDNTKMTTESDNTPNSSNNNLSNFSKDSTGEQISSQNKPTNINDNNNNNSFANNSSDTSNNNSNNNSNTNVMTDDVIPNAVVIKNIPFAIKKEQLLDIIDDSNLPLPYAFNYHFDNGIFRGLAFANFTTTEETIQIINGLNGKEINGRKLKVEYKKLLPQAERERIEREKREKRGQLEEQHRTLSNLSLQSLNGLNNNANPNFNNLSNPNLNNLASNSTNMNHNMNNNNSSTHLFSTFMNSSGNNNTNANSNINTNNNNSSTNLSSNALGLLNNLSSTSLNNMNYSNNAAPNTIINNNTNNQTLSQQQIIYPNQNNYLQQYQNNINTSNNNSSNNSPINNIISQQERFYAPLPSSTNIPLPPQQLDFNDPDTLELYSQLLLFKDREKFFFELTYPNGLSANHKRIINVLCSYLNLIEIFDPRFIIIRRKKINSSNLKTPTTANFNINNATNTKNNNNNANNTNMLISNTNTLNANNLQHHLQQHGQLPNNNSNTNNNYNNGVNGLYNSNSNLNLQNLQNSQQGNSQQQISFMHSLQPNSTGGSMNRSQSYTSLLQAHAAAMNINKENKDSERDTKDNNSIKDNEINLDSIQADQSPNISGKVSLFNNNNDSPISIHQPLPLLHNSTGGSNNGPSASSNQQYIRQQTITPSSRVPSGYLSNNTNQSKNSVNPLLRNNISPPNLSSNVQLHTSSSNISLNLNNTTTSPLTSISLSNNSLNATVNGSNRIMSSLHQDLPLLPQHTNGSVQSNFSIQSYQDDSINNMINGNNNINPSNSNMNMGNIMNTGHGTSNNNNNTSLTNDIIYKTLSQSGAMGDELSNNLVRSLSNLELEAATNGNHNNNNNNNNNGSVTNTPTTGKRSIW